MTERGQPVNQGITCLNGFEVPGNRVLRIRHQPGIERQRLAPAGVSTAERNGRCDRNQRSVEWILSEGQRVPSLFGSFNKQEGADSRLFGAGGAARSTHGVGWLSIGNYRFAVEAACRAATPAATGEENHDEES